MSDVKIIPLSREYKENWDKIFGRGGVSSNAPVSRREDEGENPSPDARK